ncbi:MerR family transcriptional regulator [Isosphaeraceae bacterium EP7]
MPSDGGIEVHSSRALRGVRFVRRGTVSTTSGSQRYSIAGVSKLTGVSCHALRVWERRYGFPEPERSPSGHRRYDIQQVRVLRMVSDLVHQGQAIGTLMAKVRAGHLLADEAGESYDDAVESSRAESPASELLDLLIDGDRAAAEAWFDDHAARLGPLDLLAEVIEPALVEIGDRRYRGECETFQEHTAGRFLRNKLDRMLDEARRRSDREGPPRGMVLVGTAQGNPFDGGILMISVVLELAGWQAVDIGVDLPVEEFAKAAQAWTPDALAISFLLSRNINKRFAELSKITGLPIFVSGRSILNYQSLARGRGLTPLSGTIRSTAAMMVAELECRRIARDA